MEALSIKGKIAFADCLRRILFELYGEEEADTYAYYQKHCHFIFKVEADVVEHCTHYFRLQCVIRNFEYLCRVHQDIGLFEIVPKHVGDEVTVLTWIQFFERRHEFYEREGRRIKAKHEPMSLLYVGAIFLDYVSKDIRGSLYTKDYVPNGLASQVNGVYQEMIKQNYHFSTTTTVKEFYRDIIEPLYPNMSKHDQNYIWRFFKPQTAIAV